MGNLIHMEVCITKLISTLLLACDCEFTFKKKVHTLITRLHSCRMRTARLLTMYYTGGPGRGCLTRHTPRDQAPPRNRPPWEQTPPGPGTPGTRHPSSPGTCPPGPGGVPSPGGAWSRGVSVPRGIWSWEVPGPGGVYRSMH